MCGSFDKAVLVHILNVDQYPNKGIYARVNQNKNPNRPLRCIDEAHCQALSNSFRHYDCGYARGIITVYVSATVSPEPIT